MQQPPRKLDVMNSDNDGSYSSGEADDKDCGDIDDDMRVAEDEEEDSEETDIQQIYQKHVMRKPPTVINNNMRSVHSRQVGGRAGAKRAPH